MDVSVIGRQNPSPIVVRARNVAGEHLESMFQKLNVGKEKRFDQFHWVKPEFTSPSFEHFTFGYKNSVFPVLVDVVVDGKSTLPQEKIDLLIQESNKYILVPCIIKVKYTKIEPDANGLVNGVYGKSAYSLTVDSEGWNLFHAETGEPLDPCRIAHDNPMPMSEWELMNFAIGIVRSCAVEKEGFKLDSFCDIPGIDPQIWIRDSGGKHAWVLVRFQSVLNEGEIEKYKEFVSSHPYLKPYDGYFALVSAVSSEPVLHDMFDRVVPLSKRFDGSQPIYRGSGMYVNFKRMIKIHVGEGAVDRP